MKATNVPIVIASVITLRPPYRKMIATPPARMSPGSPPARYVSSRIDISVRMKPSFFLLNRLCSRRCALEATVSLSPRMVSIRKLPISALRSRSSAVMLSSRFR